MKWIIDIAFCNDSKQYMFVSEYNASWNKRKHALRVSKTHFIEYINYLIDNIYVTIGHNIFRRKIGIPMGTDCAPYLANLYSNALECKSLNESMANTNLHIARKLSQSYCYIDDLLVFNF